MTVLAVIPARMGSARLPRKNMLDIEPGLSLVQQAIDCARHSGVVDEIVVSTDDTTLPIDGAAIRVRPAALCGPSSDIADAVADVWYSREQQHDWIVTLQPAVLARSPLILRTLLCECMRQNCSGLTMAHSVVWHWSHSNGMATAPWLIDGKYPRSQDVPHQLVEVNAIQIAPASVVKNACRWSMPLLIARLPAWTVALDIDEPADMATARRMWPFARKELETCVPTIERIDVLHLRDGAA